MPKPKQGGSTSLLLRVTEHDPVVTPPPVVLFARFPSLLSLVPTLCPRGSKGLKVEIKQIADVEATYLENRINLAEQFNSWAKISCDEHVASFNSEPVPEGVYKRVCDRDWLFEPGELLIDGKDMGKLNLHIEYQIEVTAAPMISHFEVQSRGRYFRFAPITVGEGTLKTLNGYIVFGAAEV